ncbi:TetR family transcriptional regulator [Actinoplanes sp. HUAS TT8]|uniref:TetR/AcrR family transcriptional regulator n=1 Tax=Actinoplanes sp. HUAS TT8 TaxID=3447453 RepID=UPI003F52606D
MRRRDSAATKQLLLDAARRRFATGGYAATFIRDIASDAGVNVALIARYFGNKEGLFRACLAGSADELERDVAQDVAIDQLPMIMARHLTDARSEQYSARLMLLLRSSGDPRAEEIRIATLHSFAERLAEAGGSTVLDAQFVVATMVGLTILRAAGVAPLADAGQEELVTRLQRMISAML